jgi:hypothetical protein
MRQIAETMKQQGDTADDHYGELIGSFLPDSYHGPDSIEGRFLGRVSMEDVVDYMLGDDNVIPGAPKLRAATPAEQARINREVGALLERARVSSQRVRFARGRFDAVNEMIANLERDLGTTTLQDRIAKTGDSYAAAAKRIAKQLREDPKKAHPAEVLIDQIVRDAALHKGVRFDIPRRIDEMLNEYRGRMSQEQINTLNTAKDRWQKARNKVMDKTWDRYMKAAPARFRPVLTTARDSVASLIRQAEEQTDPMARSELHAIAEEITTNLQGLVDAQVAPVHQIGGMPRRVPGLAGAIGTTPRKLAEQFTRKEGYGPVAGEAVVRNETGQAMTRARNVALDQIRDHFGTEAGKLVENANLMSPGELAETLDGMGMVALRARRGGGILPTTTVVPKEIARVLKAWDKQSTPALQAFTKATGMVKTNLLALSPRWHAGNIIGNILMASVHGGIDPVRLATELVRMKREAGRRGMTMGEFIASMPAELTNYGLTAGERDRLYNMDPSEVAKRSKNPLAPVIRRSYAFNEFVDSMTRSAVYRSKLRRGVAEKVALESTLKAMGDFTRLSPLERRVVRQIVPFYPWLRHQTQAMLRLPVEHPMRVAFLGYLSNLYNDPSLTPDERRLLGLRVPIPGLGDVSLGFANPFPELPGSLGQVGQQIGQGLNPIIKEPAAQLFGLDLGNLRQIPRPTAVAQRAQGAFGTEPNAIFGLSPSDLGASAYHAAGILPVTRGIRSLLAPPDIQRYSTGEQVGRRPKPSGRSQLSTLAQAAGLPAWDEGIDPKRLAKLRKAAGG